MTSNPASVRNSPAAVWSLVLGILSIVLCLGLLAGIPAIICGIVAQGGIKKSAGALKGAGMAVTGLILGSIGTLFSIFVVPIVAAMVIPAISTAQHRAHEVSSMNNVKQISMACMMYAQDHDGQIPESLDVLVKEGLINEVVLRNPRDRESTAAGYELVYRGRIADAADISTTPLVIEKVAGPRGRVVGFLDGHVELIEDGNAVSTAPSEPEPQPEI